MSKPVIIKATNLIEKRNILNEMKVTCLTLQESRIFAIYLSRINARDINTRLVKFKLEDFLAIVNIRNANIPELMEATNKLLSIIINIPDGNGGYSAFQLFKKCKVYKDKENEEWFFELDAHDESLPLMFDFKNKYFTYQVDNVLRLNSPYQMRIYEILKQYEYTGSRILSLDKLKEIIGIEKNEYPRFNNFRQWILEPCQKALSENTDIKFSFEPYGKKGKGGKILSLKFYIEKNEDFIDQMTFTEFIDVHSPAAAVIDEDEEEDLRSERLELLAEACNNEFSKAEILVLLDELRKYLPWEMFRDDIQAHDYLQDKYHEMLMRAEKTKITHRFAYLKSILGKENTP